jgi:cold shock CspA family protein
MSYLVKSHEGIITLYHQKKGWGFITESSGEEWFFHVDNCGPKYIPKLSDAVKFIIGPPISIGKKDQAVDVCLQKAEGDGVQS